VEGVAGALQYSTRIQGQQIQLLEPSIFMGENLLVDKTSISTPLDQVIQSRFV
jgi:hypothetical protein